MSRKIIIKTSVRFVVYQALLLFAAGSTVFLMNPIYWGNRAPVLEQSYSHIFNPIEYDENVERFVKNIGRTRLYFEITTEFLGVPNLFEIVEDSEYVVNEEWYNCEYQYVDNDGVLGIYKYRTRVRWKPWEFQFPSLKDIEPTNGISDDNTSK